MIINSTNINKTNLSSELNSLNTKKTTKYDVGNQLQGKNKMLRKVCESGINLETVHIDTLV